MTVPSLTAILIILFVFIFVLFVYSFMSKAHSNQDAEPQPRPISSDHPQSAGSEGLDPNTVHALPVLKYAGAKEAGGCAICLGEFFDDMVKVIPGCGHVFHPGCIDRWLLLHGSCPICRCSDVVGENVGAIGGGEVRVDFGSGVHCERAEDGRKLVASGSRSSRAGVERESAVSLQRTLSL